MKQLLFALFAVTSAFNSYAADFASGTDRIDLVELYTSEGCSSCPPADRWMSSLKSHPGLWRDFVPVAFHVDYWDHIGWTDRFASPHYSNRQRSYARERKLSTVYTPGFVVGGGEWRGWFSNKTLPKSEIEVGVLAATLTDGKVELRFDAVDSAATYRGHVALLGGELASEVTAGENRGRTLAHDFVVLEWQTFELQRRESAFTGTTKLVDAAALKGANALAVWVSGGESQIPVQATGGWLAAHP